MKVNIFGVARSGTTALYSLIQEIMLDNHKKTDFIYEPFLWDKDVFNDRYANKSHNFKYMHALSFEGIVNHLELPMLIDDPDEYISNPYVHELLKPENKQKNILTKFVRANGRFNLIQNICPACKSIIIVRNPVDTINSVVNSFSFYGGEFHKDDFTRFITEINDTYTDNLNINVYQDTVEKESLYWYYMTRHILEAADDQPSKPLVLSYEEFINSREETISRICNYLGYEFSERYVRFNEKELGLVTEKKEIAKKDLDVLSRYLYIYFQLLDKYKIEYHFNKESILQKYTIVQSKDYSKKFYGYIPLKISREYDLLKHQLELTEDRYEEKQGLLNTANRDIESKSKEISKIREESSLQEQEVTKLNKEVQELKKKIQEHKVEIQEYKVKIQKKDKDLEANISKMKDLNFQIERLNKMVKEQLSRIEEFEQAITAHVEESKSLNNLVTSKNSMISGLNLKYENEMQKKKQEIDAIYNSWSWKIGRSFTKTIGFFMFWKSGDKK